jgi:hypothetical protein
MSKPARPFRNRSPSNVGPPQIFDCVVDDPPDKKRQRREDDDLIDKTADLRIVQRRRARRAAAPIASCEAICDPLRRRRVDRERCLPAVSRGCDQRIGGAYCRPPLLHRALRPRAIFSGLPGRHCAQRLRRSCRRALTMLHDPVIGQTEIGAELGAGFHAEDALDLRIRAAFISSTLAWVMPNSSA